MELTVGYVAGIIAAGVFFGMSYITETNLEIDD